MIRFKIKLAIRNLLKNKMYSALIIGGFAIGFTASMLIALFYNAEHNVNTQFSNHKNIYRLYDAKKNKCALDYNLLPTLTEKYPEVISVCPMEYSSNYVFTLKDSETHDYIRLSHIVSTTNSFFDIFSVKVVASLSDKPFNDLNSAVITESTAKKLFGNKNPLGRIVKEEFFGATISAVVKDIPENSSFKAELFLNSESKDFQMSQECENNKCIYPTSFFLLLKNTANPELLLQKLNNTIKQETIDSLALQKLTDIYLSTQFPYNDHAKGNPKMLRVFLFIALLIIILSSINYLNYTISMQYAKLKDIGINKTNGASWMQLVANSFIEVSFGVLISLVISITLTYLLLPYTGILFGRQINLTDVNLYQFLPLLLGTTLGVILLNSLAPIYILSKFNITDFLAGGRRRNGRQIGRQIMLIFQLTTSIALIAIVMFIYKQIQYVKHYDLGFDKEHLLRLDLPYLYSNPNLIKDEMSKLPFVVGSTLSDGHPGWINLMMGSGTDKNEFLINCIYVSDDYIETMGIQLLQGRNFLSGDEDKACLMNEEAIKKYDWDSIKDKKYKNGNENGYWVIGEVKDFNVSSLHEAIGPVALLYDPSHRFGNLSLRLTLGNIGQQIDQIRQVWEKLMPEDPMEFTFYDDEFQSMYSKEEKLVKAITFFSFIAVVITCMGLLGQFFLIGLRRTKEIGIRKVNGAKIREILVMLNKNFLIWILASFIVATPIAYYVIEQWLQNFAYRTGLSWWVFGLAGLVTLIIELLTVSWLSWRAATRNPVDALRYE